MVSILWFACTYNLGVTNLILRHLAAPTPTFDILLSEASVTVWKIGWSNKSHIPFDKMLCLQLQGLHTNKNINNYTWVLWDCNRVFDALCFYENEHKSSSK